jgi:magnesium and cobalt transporter
MGDTTDGPSNAAQSAQLDPHTVSSNGFFSRLFGAKSAQPTAEVEITNGKSVVTVPPKLGLSNLRQKRVEDVAIPKADIVAVPATVSKDELVSVFRESGLTRLPIYDGTLDTPVGLVHLKDFSLKHGFNGNAPDFDVRKVKRPLLFVPPSMPLHVLMQKMQAERIHMALVIDEYGGTDGLVTIEDLIEQVVGEIEDEHDVDEAETFILEKPGFYMAQAKTDLEDFEAEIGIRLTEAEEIDAEEVDTLGGLVFMLAGHVPVRGEVIHHPAGPEFEVVDADPRRIKRLRVKVAVSNDA